MKGLPPPAAAIPPPLDSDDDDVAWALQTAQVQWKLGAFQDALVWLRRAVDSAIDAGHPERAAQINRLEASLAEQLAGPPNPFENPFPPGPLLSATDDDEDPDDMTPVRSEVEDLPLDARDVSLLPYEIEDVTDVTDHPEPNDAVDDLMAVPISVKPEPQREEEPTERRLPRPPSLAPRPVRPPSSRAPLPSRPSAPVRPPRSLTPAARSVKPAPPRAPLPPARSTRPAFSRSLAPSARSVTPRPNDVEELEEDVAVPLSSRPPPASDRPPAPASDRPPSSRRAPSSERSPVSERGPFSERTAVTDRVPYSDRAPAGDTGSASEPPPGPASARATPSEPSSEPPPRTPPEPATAPSSAPPARPEPEPEPQEASIGGVELADVPGLQDLPEDAQLELVKRARIEELAPEEEVSAFAVALVLDGWVNIMPTVADAACARAQRGEVVFTRGTLEERVALRVVSGHHDTRVAVWEEEALSAATADCPWVADELRLVADRFQALAGACMGPMGDRLDDSLRAMVTDKCEVKGLLPGETILEQGRPMAGLFIAGAGRLEVLRDGGDVAEELGPGDFVFAAEMLGGAPAPATVRAGSGGALVLFAERRVAHELMVVVPPLLEILAG